MVDKYASLFLGIDIGTSKVAVVVFSPPNTLVSVLSSPHDASIPQSAHPSRSEQDPNRIISVCFELIRKLDPELRAKIAAVGVTGQMHGIVLLNKSLDPVSPLINWQDQRCLEDPGFLPGLRSLTGCSRLNTGFGLATLAWMRSHTMVPKEFAHCCTVQDLVVARLISASRPVTDCSTAASWGLFGLKNMGWNTAAAAKILGEDLVSKLPAVLRCGAVAGVTRNELGVLPVGIPVMAAIGDNQASLLATLESYEDDIALTLGTGGQVSVAVEHGETFPESKFEIRPFVDGKVALVAAPMCGGAAWQWLARFLQETVATITGAKPDIETVYETMNREGMKAASELVVNPHFLGERYDETLRASIAGITLDNASVGSLARGLARGIVRNLKQMLPESAMKGRKRVVGSGNALRKVPLLQRMVEEEFGVPLMLLSFREEAAVGAAINASRGYNKAK